MNIKSNQIPLFRAVIMACTLLLVPGCKDEKKTAPEPEAVPAVQPASSADAPQVLPSILKINREKKTYAITGIGVKGSQKVAIINNQVVKPGEALDDGVYIKDVQPTYAIIVVGNQQHLLRPEDIQRELDRKKLHQ